MKYIDKTVRVTKAPEEAPHLLGKTGVVTHTEDGWICVCIGDRFIHFGKHHIEIVGQPETASEGSR